MRLVELMGFVALCLVPSLLSAQQSASAANDSGVTGGSSADTDGLWAALINMLDEQKGLVAYDDLNRELLSKFNCHDEYNRSSMGYTGEEKGVEDRGVKSHCDEEVVIQYAGRTHYIDGRHFRYTLTIKWNPTAEKCRPAGAAIKLLVGDGWRVPQTSFPTSPGPPRVNFVEPYPNTESWESKFGDELVSVHWAPRENLNSLQNVDPAVGCLDFVDVRN
jgi:hypothetical protein